MPTGNLPCFKYGKFITHSFVFKCMLRPLPHPLTPSSLDLWKEFPEESYSVALHPSGLYVLVGFSEKLRLMNVLIDDIRPFKEFMIRGCREVREGLYCSCKP